MSEIMPIGFVCWDADGLELIRSNVGDLSHEDNSILSATHEPVTVRVKMQGTEFPKFDENFIGDNDEFTEEKLLEAINNVITDPTAMSRNLLIAVKGETGSGKSHLVRWLYQNVKKTENTRVVWVTRGTDQKMQVVKKFVEDLAKIGSPKAEELRKMIAGRLNDAEKKPEELVQELYDKMSYLLRYDKGLISEDKNKEVLDLIIGEVEGKTRLSNLIDTHKNDDLRGRIKDGFKPILRRVVDQSISKESKTSVGFTRENTEKILKAYQKYKLGDNDLLTMALNHSDAVTGLLNQALDIGMNQLMRLEGSLFKDIFAELREEMSKLGQQLVIFLEDFSGASVVEKGLSKLQRDLLAIFTEVPSNVRAPLRVVMAITNNTFDSLEENYLRRHNLTVDIDHSFDEHDPMPFLSRYLNISRTNRLAVQQAYDELTKARTKVDDWVPNACDSCPHRVQCHATFGASNDGVGFYPLNAEIGRRIVLFKEPDGRITKKPGKRVNKLEGLLQRTQNEIKQGDFPSLKVSKDFLVFNEQEELEIANLNFVRGAENETESKKLARYVYLWKKNVLPTDIEKTVFKLQEFGEIIRAVDPGLDTTTTTTTSTTDISPSIRKEIASVKLWKNAESDVAASIKLGHDTHGQVRRTIYTLIKENFENLECTDGLKIYEEAFGLYFKDSSIRISGFEARAVKTGLLNPVFSIPRNHYGEMVLTGALLNKSHPGSKTDLSESQINEAGVSLSDFILQKVNDLVKNIRKIEKFEDGPIGGIAKVIKLMTMLGPSPQDPINSQAIIEWFKNRELGPVSSLDVVDQMLVDDSNELTRVTEILTRVSKNLDGTDKFRKIDQISRLIDSFSDSGAVLVESVFKLDQELGQANIADTTSNPLPKWYSMLTQKKDQISQSLHPEAVENWHKIFKTNFETVEALMIVDFDLDLNESNKLIQQMFEFSNPGVSRNDLLNATKKILEFKEKWPNEKTKIQSLADSEPNPDLFLSHKKLVHEFQFIFDELKLFFNQVTESAKTIEKSNGGVNQVMAEVPIDLNLVTQLESLRIFDVD